MLRRLFGRSEEADPVTDQPLQPIRSDSTDHRVHHAVPVQAEPDLFPVDWSTTGLIFTNADGDIGVSLKTAVEAKLAIKDLRLRKRSLSAEKRIVTQEMAAIRREYTVKNANRGPSIRGGGNVGKFARTMDSMGRSLDRSSRERELAPLDERKRWFEARINNVDALIHHCETYMVRLEAQDETTQHVETSVVCTECDTVIDMGAKYCGECGASVR
jgi:hypothetical protein